MKGRTGSDSVGAQNGAEDAFAKEPLLQSEVQLVEDNISHPLNESLSILTLTSSNGNTPEHLQFRKE